MTSPLTPLRPLTLTVAVGVCFFATGFAGLIYEITWNRWLTLLMGNTSYALGSLLTVFMGGLALGAWAGGRWAPGGRLALAAYGSIELALGLYCWLLPELVKAAGPWFGALYRAHHGALIRLSLFQFCLAAALLLPPTMLMGATLPLLTRFLVTGYGSLSRTVGLLYAINSGGAAAGAVVAGMLLLPARGVQSSNRIAVTTNVVVGLAAIALSLVAGRRRPGEPAGDTFQTARQEGASGPAFSGAVLLCGFAVSGFAAMVYQVAWTRALTGSLGSYTYAFSLITGTFILGLTLGSLALGWTGDRTWGSHVLALLPILIALAAVCTVAQLGQLPVSTALRIARVRSLPQLAWSHFTAILPIFLLPTFLMGGMLPIVSRHLAQRREDAARSVGRAYGANALGTIAGSFCGGFLLVPWVGMRASILIGAALSSLVGLAFLHQALRGRVRARAPIVALAGVVALSAILAAPRWDRSIIASGPYYNFRSFAADPAAGGAEVIRRIKQHRLLYYQEDVAGLVTVIESPDGLRRLLVGGKPEAVSRDETQTWLGHLPLLLRPDARDVLVIGVGSGATAAGVAGHAGVRRIDAVEISPAVVTAARGYFADSTGHVLDDPRLALIIGDGRLHLEHSDSTYDVVISQPANAWVAGSAALFTRESFAAAKRRLAPGGLFCAWFQGFHVSLDDFRVLAATWADTWQHPSIWMSRVAGNYLFVGSDVPLSVDFERLEGSLAQPGVAEAMAGLFTSTPADVMSHLLTADDGVRVLAAGAEICTDDNSRIEFDIPRSLWRTTGDEVFARLHEVRSLPWRYVTGGDKDRAGFSANRERSAVILADQYKIVQALGLTRPEERQQRLALLAAVLEHSPHDPIASREYQQMLQRR